MTGVCNASAVRNSGRGGICRKSANFLRRSGLLQPVHGFPQIIAGQVRVPLSDVGRPVAEKLRNGVEGNSPLRQPRGERPAEVVESKAPDPGPSDGCLEVVDHVMRLIGLTGHGIGEEVR